MSKKSIIICLAFIAGLCTVIAVSVYFLYADINVADSAKTTIDTVVATATTQTITQDTTQVTTKEVAKEVTKLTNQSATKDSTKVVTDEIVKVNVPSGPFKVKNSATGKICYIGQSSDDAIYMESDGKSLWTIPMQGRMAGCVASIDYYENGKLQYLFITGNKLHLVDRHGRHVKTFPKTLAKEVLLGPEAYDFNGNRVYNFLVLNTDNTIDMYNMKGVKPSSWKGITSDETILNLPDMVQIARKSYWVVHTTSHTLVFSFYGGQPVKVFDGNVTVDASTNLK